MNFGVGTFRVRTYFWPNLNPPLEHLIKVVLNLIDIYRKLCTLDIHNAFIFMASYNSVIG